MGAGFTALCIMKIMSQRKERIQILYRLLVSTMLMVLVHAIANNVLALFITPIAQSLGTSRSEVALLNTFKAIASIFGAPVWGWLYKRAKVKVPLLGGLAAFAVLLYLMSIVRNLLLIYVMAFLIGFVFAGITVMPVTLIVLEAAPERQRALMLSIALSGSGLGGMILNPLANALIQNHGYGRAFLILSLLVALLLLPLVWFMPAHAPLKTAKGETPAADSSGKKRTDQKLKLKPYLTLLAACFLTSFTSLAVLLNLPSYLQLCGYDFAAISLMTSLGSASLLVGKILLGYLYDRLDLKKATLIACASGMISTISLVLMPNPVALAGYLLFFGLGAAVGTVSPSYMAARFFHKDRAQAMSGMQVGIALGTATGVPLMAKLLEVIPKFQLSWLFTGVLIGVMSLLFLTAIRLYRQEAQREPTA
jgi:MFS family permease